MSAFFTALGSFSRTFGTTMNGEVQKVAVLREGAEVPSALEAALDGPNIPVSVYTRLVDGVNKNLPAFHRYLRLRKRMMGVDELHYYDLYAPLVGSVNLKYTPEEAQKHMLAAVAPLGPDYAGDASSGRSTSAGSICFPNDGKRSGAYSNGGAYDVHPYMLLNYNGQYDDVSTLAHELGHTMQSYLLEQDAAVPAGRLPDVRRRGRVHVQRGAAHRLHAQADQGRRHAAVAARQLPREHQGHGLPADAVRRVRAAHARDGAEGAADHRRRAREAVPGHHASGTTATIRASAVVDDYIAHEWSYIPHFYRDFYVFQYATSFTASEALAQKVKAGDPAATKRYLAFLAAGGSKYPIDLLKDAGVDMTTDEPLDLTMKEMNRVMDEMEKILAAKGK